MKKLLLTGVALLALIFAKAQDVTYATNDIVAGVASGSTTATLTKSGYSLTITKTGGSTSPVHGTYPTGAPLNTIPADPVNNVEGLHIGSTWNGSGTGWVDAFGQIRSENYTFDFSADLDKFTFYIGALNDNLDGIEKLRIVDVLDGGVSVLSSCTFSIRTDYDDPMSDSIVINPTTHDIEGQGFPKSNGWNESSIVTIQCSKAFDRIVFERKDYTNNRADKNVGGENYTNGLTITGFAAYVAHPEIDVKGNKVSIADGDNTPSSTDSTLYGSVAHNLTKTLTYWIYNTGAATLNLIGGTPVTISGSGDFTVTQQPASNNIAVGDSVSFKVTFDPSTTGTKTATVSIANNDANENPYTFDVQAIATNDAPVAVIDRRNTNEDQCINVDVQFNDTDANGDALTTTITDNFNHGAGTLLSNDSISYCPSANYNGGDTLLYQICDAFGACDIDSVIITIIPVNDAPVAVIDHKTTSEDVCVHVDVHANDSDPDGDALTTTILSSATHGFHILLNNDSLNYCPNAGYTGKDTIIYQVCDSNGGCDNDTVIITIVPVNDDPVADTDYKTTPEDQCVNIDVQDNDSDPEGDALTTTIITSALHGTQTILNGDSLNYCPDADYSGNDTIIYQICDGNGGCDIDTVYITVTPANDKPVAVNDTQSTLKNVCVKVFVQTNDSDPDGDVLTTAIIDDVNNGTTTLLNNDSVSYCPATNYIGNDTLFYSICDGNGGCDTARVIIMITDVNGNPDADTDYKTTPEDQCVNVDVQDNDTDPDGNPLTTTIITSALHGTETVLNGDSLSYCPDADYNGNDTIVYQVCDGLGACDIDTVFITVTPVNDKPVAVGDTQSTLKNVCVKVFVQSNDSDADGDALTTAVIDDVNNGTTTLLNNDSISYCPANNYAGNDTLFYSICDGNGGCDTARVIITVVNVNGNPDADTDYKTTNEDQCVHVDVQANDSDPDNDPLTTTVIASAKHGIQNILNGDSLNYCPNANYHGKDTIIYQVCDGLGGCDIDTVFITVAPVNDDPVADTDYKSTNKNVCTNVDVQLNDSDPDGDNLTTTIVSAAKHGTGNAVNGDNITYCPANNYTGNDTIIYQICDGNGACDIDTVYITINNVNNNPDADTDYKTTNEDQCVHVDVQMNDSDPDGDALTTVIITSAKHGTQTVLSGDSLNYCPNANYNGKDTVIYQVCDGLGACDIDTVFITVTPVNDVPVANTDTTSTGPNECVVVKVQSNDSDIDGDALTTTISVNPLHGTATVLNNDSIEYCPAEGFYGKDTLIYQMCDGAKCDTAYVIITVAYSDCDNDGIPDAEDNAKDCDFFIPEGYSPNSDNVNDTWVIRGILNYPNNTVRIFNRWGNLVYEKDGYKNEWDGTTMFGITLGGNELPEGTYFYIVDLGNNTKVYKGYVYLKR
ncbi:MAG: Ig-like domain-containing protein [Flavobacteriales bacterium]